MTITIESIFTKPEHDPYTNIEGIVSKTYLKLDPRDRTAWVTQEYQDNSTPIDEWNGLILTWKIYGHPSENDMRQWIEDNMDVLVAICDGFEVVWNGNNHVGSLDDNARFLKESIEFLFDNGGLINYYESWTVEDWLDSSINEISAEMTNEQLKEFAKRAEPDNSILVDGNILEYITQRRDTLRWEAEIAE